MPEVALLHMRLSLEALSTEQPWSDVGPLVSQLMTTSWTNPLCIDNMPWITMIVTEDLIKLKEFCDRIHFLFDYNAFNRIPKPRMFVAIKSHLSFTWGQLSRKVENRHYFEKGKLMLQFKPKKSKDGIIVVDSFHNSVLKLTVGDVTVMVTDMHTVNGEFNEIVYDHATSHEQWHTQLVDRSVELPGFKCQLGTSALSEISAAKTSDVKIMAVAGNGTIAIHTEGMEYTYTSVVGATSRGIRPTPLKLLNPLRMYYTDADGTIRANLLVEVVYKHMTIAAATWKT